MFCLLFNRKPAVCGANVCFVVRYAFCYIIIHFLVLVLWLRAYYNPLIVFHIPMMQSAKHQCESIISSSTSVLLYSSWQNKSTTLVPFHHVNYFFLHIKKSAEFTPLIHTLKIARGYYCVRCYTG